MRVLKKRLVITFTIIFLFACMIPRTYSVRSAGNYDFNNDGRIDITDLAQLSQKYNTISSSQGWDLKFDLNSDSKVDIFDVVLLSTKIGTSNIVNSLLGNTAGNINNGGLVAFRNNWLYTNTIDSRYIFKLRLDGSEEKMLNTQPSLTLNVTDNYIIYSNAFDNYKIYRMNLDGTDARCINSVDATVNMITFGDYIYYLNANDIWSIYRMKLDGTDRKKLTDGASIYMNVTEQYIYYSSKDTGLLYRINTDGTNKKLLSSQKTQYTLVDSQYIYFVDNNDYNNLYRMKLDGTDCIKLSGDRCEYLNMSGNVIYYSNISDNGKIYAIKTDGTKRKAVNSEASYNINIAGDTIYYQTQSDYGETHKVKTVNLDIDTDPVSSGILGNLPGNINNFAYAAYDGKNIYILDAGTSAIYKYDANYTNKIRLGTVFGTHLNAANGWVYYSDMSPYTAESGNERIYKLKADGSGERMQISSKRPFYMTLSGDWIYFVTEADSTNYPHSGPIYKVRTDGSGETLVDSKNLDYASCLNFYGDYIYYINTKDGNKIYKMKTDGTGREMVGSEAGCELNIMGDYLYYYSITDGVLKRMPVTGGSPVAISLKPEFYFSNIIITSDKMFYLDFNKLYSSNLDGSSVTLLAQNISDRVNVAGDFLYYIDAGLIKSIKIR